MELSLYQSINLITIYRPETPSLPSFIFIHYNEWAYIKRPHNAKVGGLTLICIDNEIPLNTAHG